MSQLLTKITTHALRSRGALSFTAGTLWYIPGSFGLARVLGPRCRLRSVLFHDISETESPFTKGLGGTLTRKGFESALRFITRYYTPVSLQDVIADPTGQSLPPRPILVTFDDAYASVCEFAAPLCLQFGVPAVFFVNAICLDNKQLALDNLVTYVANVFGIGTIRAAARAVVVSGISEPLSLAQVFAQFLPTVSPSEREAFRVALVQLTGIKERDLAAEARLYLTSQHLRDLATFNFEIGNHTYTHANCRSLAVGDFAGEIDRNKEVLEAISGRKVRSFSVPYGSSVDLTTDLAEHLRSAGYEAVFLAESGANTPSFRKSWLDRVSIKAGDNAELFSEIEILPRLRSIRNRLFPRISRLEGLDTARVTSGMDLPGEQN